tara:strand:- start:125 stop:2512 length:2388 start_codon:yes stop_codon:yes gene_type:complete
MARILPPSVFKANFEAAEFKPTQTQRVGERLATPEGLKVGVDVIDKVGGTVSDAVTRFSRGRAALARARKEGTLGKDTGMFGTQYLTTNPEEQAELDRQSYGAGQKEVVGAKDSTARAAGYDRMRKAWNMPGSGRLLADAARDPARLLSEDYKRLAASSPLPKTTAPKGLGPGQLADIRDRHKINRPIVDDVNVAIHLRNGIVNSEILKGGFNPGKLEAAEVKELIKLSNGLLVPYEDASGDKTEVSIMVKPNAEEQAALETAEHPGQRDAIRRGLNARALALLGLLDNENLDQAGVDIGEYSVLLNEYRGRMAANQNDPLLPPLLEKMQKLSGPISQASGSLPVYLGQSGRRATAAQAAAAQKANVLVGAAQERYAELQAKENAAAEAAGVGRQMDSPPLTSEEVKEKEAIKRLIEEKGGTLPAATTGPGGLPLEPDATTTATQESQEDVWVNAGGAPAATASSLSTPNSGAPAPSEEPAYDRLQARADHLRRNNVPEEIIAEVVGAGYEYETRGPTLMERWRGDTDRKPVVYNPNAGPGQGHQRTSHRRQQARQAAARARTRARQPTHYDAFARENIGPREALPALPAAGPKPHKADRKFIAARIPATIIKESPDKYKGHIDRMLRESKAGEYWRPKSIKKPNKKRQAEMIKLARAAAKKHKVDADLFIALLRQESKFDSNAVSFANALGIGQMLVETYRKLYGKNANPADLFKPEVGIDAAAKYLAQNIKKHGGSIKKGVASYNAGPNTFRHKKGNYLPHTQKYIKIILGEYKKTKKAIAAKAPPKAPKQGS